MTTDLLYKKEAGNYLRQISSRKNYPKIYDINYGQTTKILG
jgi:hypothetical protein